MPRRVPNDTLPPSAKSCKVCGDCKLMYSADTSRQVSAARDDSVLSSRGFPERQMKSIKRCFYVEEKTLLEDISRRTAIRNSPMKIFTRRKLVTWRRSENFGLPKESLLSSVKTHSLQSRRERIPYFALRPPADRIRTWNSSDFKEQCY